MVGEEDLAIIIAGEGYSHCSSAFWQCLHLGLFSWHLIFRFLQLKHPLLDLVWPLRGIGRRLATAPVVETRSLARISVGITGGKMFEFIDVDST